MNGAFSSQRVMEELKGRLSADGNRAGPVRGKAGLTARGTSRADAKAAPSDPMAMVAIHIPAKPGRGWVSLARTRPKLNG